MQKKTITEIEIKNILRSGNAEQQFRQERKIRYKFWPTMKRALAQFPFAEDVVTAYFCALDRKTPPHVRGVLLAALAYFILPTDLVPDFIAVIGFGDDAAVLATASATLQKHMSEAQRKAAKKALDELIITA